MFSNAVIKALLAAASFVLVAGRGVPAYRGYPNGLYPNNNPSNYFNPVVPYNQYNPSFFQPQSYPYPAFNPFPSYQPYPAYFPASEPDTVHEERVFGTDVEGAAELINSEASLSYDSKHEEISSDFSYPYNNFIVNNKKITKIVVVIKNIDQDATFDVVVKGGGVNQNQVLLQVVAKNSRKLKYSVKLFGIPEGRH